MEWFIQYVFKDERIQKCLNCELETDDENLMELLRTPFWLQENCERQYNDPENCDIVGPPGVNSKLIPLQRLVQVCPPSTSQAVLAYPS